MANQPKQPSPANQPSSAAPEPVTIHLLDSAQGHPVQTWRFRDKVAVTIGRSDECDVVIADQHVSRTHATLVWRAPQWEIVSSGRHGTLVNDRLVAETVLGRSARLRLGAHGPMLRFEAGLNMKRQSETLDSIQPDLIEMLEIDFERQQQEADEISDNDLFRDMRDRVRRAKEGLTGDTRTE